MTTLVEKIQKEIEEEKQARIQSEEAIYTILEETFEKMENIVN